MAKPTLTTAPTGQTAPFGLRLMPELRSAIENAARESGRSMNAEVVARLKASFEGGSAELPFTVQQAVDDVVEAQGCTREQALERLVLAGQAMGGTIFNLTVAPGMKFSDVRVLLEASKVVIPPDATIILERGQ